MMGPGIEAAQPQSAANLRRRTPGRPGDQEATHLPFDVVHPGIRVGQDRRTLTGHIDVVPTRLTVAGVTPEEAGNPAAADIRAPRGAILFTNSRPGANDSTLRLVAGETHAASKKPALALPKSGFKPDIKERDGLRATFDGTGSPARGGRE